MGANETDIDTSESARIEHRLTKLEQAYAAGQKANERGFEEVKDRLDAMNGKVARHEQRLNEHDVSHARADGAREENLRLRPMDRAFVAITAVSGLAAAIISALRS